jgi:signal transduction histidine kinase
MMRKMLTVFVFVLSAGLTAQKSVIDSINNLPFDTMINRAATIDALLLQNAKNAEKIKYLPGLADSYSNLALAYYYQGKYRLNVDYQLKAIKIYESLGNTEKAAGEYGGLGYSMKRRNMAKAQYYMLKGKSMAETSHHELPLLAIYDNYGVLKEMQNQPDSALYFYNKSLSLKEKRSDSVGIPYSLNNIAGIYVMENRFDEAGSLYRRALKIRELKKDEIGLSESHANMGNLYFARKDYRNAVTDYKKSLDIALKNKYIFGIQSMYKSLADSYEMLGNPSAAFSNFKKYAAYKDSILNKETNSKIAELEIQFETNKKEKLLLRRDAEVKKRNNLILAISVITFFIALTGFLFYRQQKLRHKQLEQQHDLKTAISQIETQNKLQHQRLEISRDLHDNIGAQLTFIISSMENIRYAFDLKDLRLERKLQSIGNFTRETIVELRDTIWAMNHSAISFEDLRARILNFIEKAREAQGHIYFRFSIAEDLGTVVLTSVQGMNIYRTIQEAVNNALKYANASEISIAIYGDEQIKIAIGDNGSGFDESEVALGSGILNMQKRMDDIGATLSIASKPGKGTEINIEFQQMN